MSSSRHLRLGLAAALATAFFVPFGAAPVAAQQSVLDEGALRLTLEKIPDIDRGSAVLLQGQAGANGDKFFIENLNVTQPVTVVLMAANPKQQPLTLNLSKYRFDQSDRAGSTGDTGAVAFDFRTQGELKIWVKPQHDDPTRPARYFLIAWVGDDLTPKDLPIPVVSAAGMAGGSGTPMWLLLVGAAVAGAILVLAAIGLRSLRSDAAKMVIFLVVAVGLSAVPISLLAEATALGSLGAMRAAAQAMEWENEDAAVQDEINEAGRKAIDEGFDHLENGMKLYEASRGFTEADAALSEVLNPDDNAFNPDFNPAGAPSLPAHCASEGGEDCVCYQKAYDQLNFVRFYLERLRAIYGATKNYSDNAIAFGDSMAGLNGGFGLAWPPERKGIQDAVAHLGVTYDEKYQDYMRGLREALESIATCEKEHHDVDDWYNRFGFIYYSFIQDRYKR
jgi:hypothetical protein